MGNLIFILMFVITGLLLTKFLYKVLFYTMSSKDEFVNKVLEKGLNHINITVIKTLDHHEEKQEVCTKGCAGPLTLKIGTYNCENIVQGEDEISAFIYGYNSAIQAAEYFIKLEQGFHVYINNKTVSKAKQKLAKYKKKLKEI